MKLVWQIIYPIAVYEILTAGVFLLFPDMQALAAQGISAAAALAVLGTLYVRGRAQGRYYTGRAVNRLFAGTPRSRLFAKAPWSRLFSEKPGNQSGAGRGEQRLQTGRPQGRAVSAAPRPEEVDFDNRFHVPADPFARIFQCICIGSVSCILFNDLISLSGLEQLFTGYQDNLARIYAPPVWQQVVLAGLLLPAAEELVFRGMIYGTLRRRFAFPAAMIVSAFIFGLYHGSLVQGLYGICMGLVLAESFEHRGGFCAAVTVHAAANLTAIFAEHFA